MQGDFLAPGQLVKPTVGQRQALGEDWQMPQRDLAQLPRLGVTHDLAALQVDLTQRRVTVAADAFVEMARMPQQALGEGVRVVRIRRQHLRPQQRP